MVILAINWGNALIITLLGFVLVILVLILLVLLLMVFGKIMTPKVRIPKGPTAQGTPAQSNDTSEYHEVNLPANTTAAIAMALHLYYADVHDEESHVITIKNVERKYSPWNSKIYGINNLDKK